MVVLEATGFEELVSNQRDLLRTRIDLVFGERILDSCSSLGRGCTLSGIGACSRAGGDTQ